MLLLCWTTVLLFLAAPPVLLGEEPGLHIIEGSIVSGSTNALQAATSRRIEVRTLQFQVDYPDAPYTLELAMFRDPKSGLFVWQTEPLEHHGKLARAGDLLANSKQAVTADKFIAFSYIRYVLWIHESKTHYASMDDAQSSLIAMLIKDLRPDIQYGFDVLRPSGAYAVRLSKRFPWLLPKNTADYAAPPTRLHSLTHSAGLWRMVLQKTNGKSAILILDDAYNLANGRLPSYRRPKSDVELVGGSSRMQPLPAIRNNQKTTIELHTAVARVTYPDGETGGLVLLMFYDPVTHLFWWTTYNTKDASKQVEVTWFIEDHIMFVADDRIVCFSGARTGRGFRSFSAFESTDRYPSFRAAQDHALSELESRRGIMQVGVHWMPTDHELRLLADMPEDFLLQCRTALSMAPRLTSVTRRDGLWYLKLEGAGNLDGAGNSATVSLSSDYRVVRTALSPDVPRPAVDKTVYSGPVSAIRNEKKVAIQARRVVMRYYSPCHYNSASPMVRVLVLMYYDPQTRLFWWRSYWPHASTEQPSFPIVHVTNTDIVEFSTVFDLEVRRSSERYSSLEEGQAHIMSLLWHWGGLDSTHLDSLSSVSLYRKLPPDFFPKTAKAAAQLALQEVTFKNDRWRIVVHGANGTPATVVLNNDFKIISATAR